MLYNFGRFVFLIILKTFYRMRVHGAENIPRRKPFIICSNHIKWVDPASIGAAFPSRYKINYMAKKELFSNFLFSWALYEVGAFPVNREEADLKAIKRAYQVLKEGKVLGLFPEGTRSKDGQVKKAYNGAALIAVRSGVPIVPVAVVGPYRLFKPFDLYIGKPFVLPPLVYDKKDSKKEMLEEMSREIMNNIVKLIPDSK